MSSFEFISGGNSETINKEAVEVASVLSVPASIVSHCLSKHYVQTNPTMSDYRSWVATFSSLCQQLTIPIDPEVFIQYSMSLSNKHWADGGGTFL